VSQYKRTALVCVPSTFGLSALLDPWCRERRFVTMNTASGCPMQKCLKVSTSACHTAQHKPQFGSARGGLPIQWLRLITLRKGTSKFPIEVHAIRTAKTWRYVDRRCRFLVNVMQSCSRAANVQVNCRSRDMSDPRLAKRLIAESLVLAQMLLAASRCFAEAMTRRAAIYCVSPPTWHCIVSPR
jgi:hypothetical protein